MMMSAWSGANVDALAGARAWLMQKRRGKDGAKCPCCDQYCKVYRRPLTSTMARWLVELVRRWQRPERTEPWLHASADWSIEITRGSGDPAKLRWWDMIEAPQERVRGSSTGLWRPTARGIAFVMQGVAVPSHAVVYNNELEALDGDRITIVQALGKRFNLADLLADAP